MNSRRYKIIVGMVLLSFFITGCAVSTTEVEREQLRLKEEQHRLEADQYMLQGITFVNQGDYNNAVSALKRSVKLHPTANAYANLGGAYMQVGKNNLAMEALKKAESMDRNDPMVLYNLTALQSKLDNTDLALQYLDRALANGFKNFNAIRFDPDLTNVRGEPEFRKILEDNKIFLQ